jgi:two-component system sensor histidine kinase KdpD
LDSDSIFLNWGNVEVEDAVASGIKSLKSGENAILLEIESDLPSIVGDPILLERVIGNLLENAVRFNPKEPPVKVSAKRVDERIELRIIDHGPGIPLKDTSRVFTPFQRLGDRDNTSGVGLGLAIVKGFTELMHGQIYLRETAEGGLTVILSFPAGETPPSASESEFE